MKGTGHVKLVLLTLSGSVAISSGIAAIGGGSLVWIGFAVGSIWALIALGIATRRGWI